ncbi:triphosphoribosyl-dephospho-CoA synthase [Rhodovastum atsumiense]|uniref:Probable 2-(5''-triphosphoribosyl)-3'-dephosphocoenzyme-A synthase n=1 Tax=Rhodovastum atsumiense TaxID=504468 RepID=A0A5M6IL41_9PROT|nr:triphosphoribosyl-dephospho-CoA synthase MdcB [Rhodovastum atsumiense]KAA5608976.1 triphosphoribosyl-dephospho-CoA synthase MdcB [Rhodovastum atsumiense]CAH2603678.1 triphosphoribosyl-dephospho-CoA synthase [Rhodovastum atsumiense]
MQAAPNDAVASGRIQVPPESLAWMIGSSFLAGALLEVCTHPKPGLVTPLSNGAHGDMDLQTFMVSSAAIAPCFYLCAQAGLVHAGAPAALLPRVREIGRTHEAALLAATGGVNTQRGLLFSAGVLSAVAGLLARNRNSLDAESLFSTAAQMTQGLCARELAGCAGREPATAGEWLYQRYGVLGIRGEAEAGFPTVLDAGLPALAEAHAAGASLQTAFLHTLISLMAVTEDTTLLWRGGSDALAFIRGTAAAILRRGGALTDDGMAAIGRLEAECICRNLSPGGSADLLAVTVGVHTLLNGGRVARVSGS